MEKYTESEHSLINQALHLISEKMRRPDQKFETPTATKDYLKLFFETIDTQNENFVVMFLDSQHGLIETEKLFQGTVDGAAVYPRVVAQRALHHNAAAIIMAHNHPSGDAEPSSADMKITERIKHGLEVLDVRSLDHIIIGGDETVSLAERGII